MLNTFQFVYKGNTISPVLTTTREYGRWLMEEYDEYTTAQQLFMKSKTRNGNTVLESHPGTRIGNFFDTQNFSKPELHCWYLLQDTKEMERLVKLGLAELRDTIPSSNKEGKRVLRIYTLEQLELYLKSTVDRNFRWYKEYQPPKQINVVTLDNLIMSKITNTRKKLF